MTSLKLSGNYGIGQKSLARVKWQLTKTKVAAVKVLFREKNPMILTFLMKTEVENDENCTFAYSTFTSMSVTTQKYVCHLIRAVINESLKVSMLLVYETHCLF